MTKKAMDTDEALLSAWQAGDKHAGACLVERHHRDIVAFFLHKVGSEEGTDLAHATFLGVLTGIGRFRGDASFRTWLFAIARNVLLKHLRTRYRHNQHIEPATTTLEACTRSPESLLAVGHRAQRLLLALRRLPIDTQLMLELHYWQNLKIEEVAVVLELPVNTVKTRMRRGRQQLQIELEGLPESKP